MSGKKYGLKAFTKLHWRKEYEWEAESQVASEAHMGHRNIADVAIIIKRYDMIEPIFRVKPRSFDCDWQKDFLDVGFKLAENMTILQYTPVNHHPTPFSVEIDMCSKTVVRQIVGVMPNAAYEGHIYSWDEFLDLISSSKEASV